MRSPATILAASNAAIGAKLITLKPVGKKSPSRRIVASQSADEVASGGRYDMESTALTFNPKKEPYSNSGAAAGHIASIRDISPPSGSNGSRTRAATSRERAPGGCVGSLQTNIDHGDRETVAASACSGEVGTGSPIKNMRQARIYSH